MWLLEVFKLCLWLTFYLLVKPALVAFMSHRIVYKTVYLLLCYSLISSPNAFPLALSCLATLASLLPDSPAPLHPQSFCLCCSHCLIAFLQDIYIVHSPSFMSSLKIPLSVRPTLALLSKITGPPSHSLFFS